MILGDYPQQWKIEYVTPIPKVTPPQSEDDLRNISLTNFFSKLFETFVAMWLLSYIRKFIDPGQCGGLPGNSISHYLVELVHFILYNWDLPTPHAVLEAFIDFSKAFNRMDHNRLIIILHQMEVPGWLLRIIVAYLTKRSMILRYNGKSSSQHWLPGGGPQGTVLGVLLFLVLINFAAFPQHEQVHIIPGIDKY